MKNFLLFSFFLFLSVTASSQVVTGVYKGQMQSDSLKTPVDFELTLKEKNGKLYGYCHRLFIVNDVLFYNLVKVNGRIKDSVLIVEDEKSVSNNFEQSTKGIKTVFFFDLKKINDTAMVLVGDWNTSTWRNNRAIAGQLVINREQNYLTTQLYKRLEEKKLDQEMAFEERVKQQPSIALNKTENQIKESNKQPGIATNLPKQNIPNVPAVNNQVSKSNDSANVALNKISNQIIESNKQPGIATNLPKQNIPNIPVVNNQVSKSNDSTNLVLNKTEIQIIEPNKQPGIATNQPKQNIPNVPVVNNSVTKLNDSANVALNKTSNQIKESNKQPSIATNKPKQNIPNVPVTNNQVSKSNDSTNLVLNKTEIQIIEPNKQPITALNQPNTNAAVSNNNQESVQQNKPSSQPIQKPTVSQKPAEHPAIITPAKDQTTAASAKTEPNPLPAKPSLIIRKTDGDSTTGISTGMPVVQNTLPVINNPVIIKREMEIIQTVDIAQDSVVLSLYDNGEIDGDTVSVFVNNELVLSKVGLSAKAFKKTLYFNPGESLQLTLYAENLGSIPPNTGLLVIYTETARYQINFTSTFSKSSSVLLRRKQ